MNSAARFAALAVMIPASLAAAGCVAPVGPVEVTRFHTPGLNAAGRGAMVAPGESGEVRLECKDPVVVARAGTRHLVVESGKKVGFVDIHLPPVPAD